MEQTRIWDRLAENYAASPIRDEQTYQKKLALTQQYLDSHSEVLEFGCGTGSTALLHSPYVKHILATDFSQGMIDIANAKLSEHSPDNVTFKCTTLLDLDSPDESFNAVLGLNVLHLLPDYEAHIQRSWALLKPGGVFATSTVCLPWFVTAPLRLGSVIGVIPRVQRISADHLESAMVDAGFSIVEKLVKGNRIQSVFLIARKTA